MRIDTLINKYYASLNETDFMIWHYIHANKDICYQLSITELAQRCNVSKTTILRFAQKLSLSGYSELKALLNLEQREKNSNVDYGDVVEKVGKMCKHSIDEISQRDYQDICALIHDADRVYIYATGALQQSIANELKRMFLCVGKLFYILNGNLETEMILPYLTDKDLVILISLRGEGETVNEFAQELHIREIPTLSLTRMKNNSLAQKCTKHLYIETSEIRKGNQVFHEVTNLFFVLVEILYLRYLQFELVNQPSFK